MSHSSSSTDGQTSYIFQPINKSRNISSLFNEQELFQYFTSAESEFRSKCYSHKSRWCLCSSHVRRQRVMLNCCMFNVIFLRNKNMQSFSIVSLSERKFIFTIFRLLSRWKWRCKLNIVMVQSVPADHADVSHFLEPFCILKSNVFVFMVCFLILSLYV